MQSEKIENKIEMAKIGDKVRFLNAVGGGVISRIEGNMAYVTDEDGFDNPVFLRECVVVEEKKEKPTAYARRLKIRNPNSRLRLSRQRRRKSRWWKPPMATK